MASVQKRPNGKWRGRYRDAAGREHARHFDRERDAKTWLATISADMLTGRYVDPKASSVTVAQFYADWSTRQVWASGTRTAMDLAMKTCTFKDVPLGALNHSHVQQWVKRMSLDLAPGTVRTRFNNVRSVLKGALRDKRLAENPMDGVTLPRRRRAEHAMTIPTPPQVGSLLDAASPRVRTFVSLCAFAGLRLGEAAGVQVGDIDFLRRSLHVQRQVQRGRGGALEITPPKYGSERVVALPDDLVEDLSVLVAEGVFGAPGWLFSGDGSNPPHQNTVGHWWRSLVAATEVPAFRLHDLRHFYASGLIAAGCDVVTVQRALGHSSATTTLRTYSHLWPDAEDRTRAAAAALMSSTTNPADHVRTNVTGAPAKG